MVYITSNVNQCDSGNPLCFLFSSWIYLWIRLKQIPRTELLRMLTPKVVNFIVILQVLFYRINTNWLLSFFFLKEYVFSNFLLHCIYPFANITTGRLDLVAWHIVFCPTCKIGDISDGMRNGQRCVSPQVSLSFKPEFLQLFSFIFCCQRMFRVYRRTGSH